MTRRRLVPRRPSARLTERVREFLKYFDFSSNENMYKSIDDEVIKYIEAWRVVVLPSGWTIYPNLARTQKEARKMSEKLDFVEKTGEQGDKHLYDKTVFSKTTPLLSGYEVWQLEITSRKNRKKKVEHILVDNFGSILPTKNAALFSPRWNPGKLKSLNIPIVVY